MADLMSSTSSSFVHVHGAPLEAFCVTVFRALGMSQADAKTQSKVLVWANLRGVDSHGVLRISRYADWLQREVMNPRPAMSVVSSTPACRVIDADSAPGAVAMTYAMSEAIDLARQSGIGWVVARKTTHAGPAGYYSSMIARQAMAGITVVTSRPNMGYHGARKPGVATSPISIAVPATSGPLVLDMATSSIALGAIKQARATGRALPENVALTSDGKPTQDPAAAAIPLPLGGPKGSGLSLLFECLLGVLVEHPLLTPALMGEPTSHSQNGLCAAIDIAAFTAPDQYEQRIDELGQAIRALPAAADDQTVMLPGEREDQTAKERALSGIPIPAAIWDDLVTLAARLGVAPPEQR